MGPAGGGHRLRSARGHHPAALVTAAELKSWLDQLPTLNAARTAELLASQATLLSDYPGPLPQLRRMLKLLHEPVLELDRAVAPVETVLDGVTEAAQ